MKFSIFNKIISLTIFVILLTLPIMTINAVQEPDPDSYSITFLGTEVVEGGIKFTYEFTSGAKPSISHWELQSCAFVESTLVEVSEAPYEYKPEDQTLKFDQGYEDYETRIVWFILELDYSSILLGDIPYSVKAGGGDNLFEDSGLIEGPICPSPDLPIPEFNFGTLGVLIPLITAVGLYIATKKNLITINLT